MNKYSILRDFRPSILIETSSNPFKFLHSKIFEHQHKHFFQ